MADENGRWRRQDDSFWHAHHEAWKTACIRRVRSILSLS
jgi:hypothetical protein